MAELYMDQFTTATGVIYGDVWPIQRLDGGVWRDFQVKNRYMFGVDLGSHTAVYNIQDLIAGAQTFQFGPGAGEIYLPLKAYAVYTPGATTDGAAIRLIGHINFEAGGNNGMCCSFVMNGNVQGGALRSSHTDILNSVTATMSFRITDPTTADGTIRVFSQFAKVAV